MSIIPMTKVVCPLCEREELFDGPPEEKPYLEGDWVESFGEVYCWPCAHPTVVDSNGRSWSQEEVDRLNRQAKHRVLSPV